MGKVLAVDWGLKRVGLAISDETKTLARPLPVLRVRGGGMVPAEIVGISRDEDVDTIVLGLPLHMDGRESTSARSVEILAERIRGALPGVRVILWDERLSSRQAASLLREKGERVGPGTKGRLDQVAATLLLQEYLDRGGP